MAILLVIGGTFLLCWLVDKGFTKLFRSQPQHMSGKSVRLSKFYGIGALLLMVIGISAIFTGIREPMLLLTVGGGMMVLLGIGLAVYYLSFGIFYDEDSFVLTTFGKKSGVYYYRQIQAQQLYRNGAQILVELYLHDGRSVQLQSSMTQVYPFLDHAFAGWCAQRGVRKEDCPFHDPDNSCWFPPVEE